MTKMTINELRELIKDAPIETNVTSNGYDITSATLISTTTLTASTKSVDYELRLSHPVATNYDR